MPTCPVCSTPFDTWGGVATHMWKKSDDEHAHVESKDDGLVYLASNGYMSDTDTSDGTSESPSETSTDTSSTPATDDPTMGTGQTPDTSEMHELPCGHEEIDLSQYESGDWVQCDDCDGKYRIS